MVTNWIWMREKTCEASPNSDRSGCMDHCAIINKLDNRIHMVSTTHSKVLGKNITKYMPILSLRISKFIAIVIGRFIDLV